jgi:hypothetical protein
MVEFKSSNKAEAEKLRYWLDSNILTLTGNNHNLLLYNELAYYFYLTSSIIGFGEGQSFILFSFSSCGIDQQIYFISLTA